jgi:RNA polymerase sigma-70 factor (sigma-E family)
MMRTTRHGEVAMTAEGVRAATDEGSLASLYVQNAPAAFRLAYLLTGDAGLAEDLVQEAFVRLIGRWTDIRRPEAFPAYLRRTVVNLSYGTFRRRRVERAYVEREGRLAATAASGLPDVETRDELWAQLDNLAPRQRAALVLRYYEDLSEQQTADVMGCSERTVNSLVTRGVQAMRIHHGRQS